MSITEIERFAADLTSNEVLRAEAEKAPAEASVTAFAASKGYVFTADDMTEYAKARKLADAELDGVAGGSISAEQLEAIRASKGIEEDRAKKVQTLMESMKDSSQKTSDFLSAFIDLQRSISAKINS